MKHIVKEFDVFTFAELSQEARQHAIDQEKNDPSRLDYDWWDFIFEDFATKFSKVGIDNADFDFNLSFCQGDYAKLAEGEVNIEKIVDKDIKFKHKQLRQIFIDYCEVSFRGGKIKIEWFYDYSGSYPYLDVYMNKIADALTQIVNEKIVSLNYELYNALYQYYLDLTSDETIEEELEDDQERLYYANGTIYSYY